MPMTSQPCSTSKAAVTELSTPPDMATTTRCPAREAGSSLVMGAALVGMAGNISIRGAAATPVTHDGPGSVGEEGPDARRDVARSVGLLDEAHAVADHQGGEDRPVGIARGEEY